MRITRPDARRVELRLTGPESRQLVRQLYTLMLADADSGIPWRLRRAGRASRVLRAWVEASGAGIEEMDDEWIGHVVEVGRKAEREGGRDGLDGGTADA